MNIIKVKYQYNTLSKPALNKYCLNSLFCKLKIIINVADGLCTHTHKHIHTHTHINGVGTWSLRSLSNNYATITPRNLPFPYNPAIITGTGKLKINKQNQTQIKKPNIVQKNIVEINTKWLS